MTVNSLAKQDAGWFDGSGVRSDVVVASRVRLARNLADLAFTGCASEADLASVTGRLASWADSNALEAPVTYFDAADLGHQGCQVLVERHLISPALADADGPRGVAVASDESVSVMVNEEDHFRIQAMGAGLDLRATWEAARGLEAELGRHFGFAFSEDWGYLTACPTNAGTGLRASILVHLPGLALTQEMESAIRAVTQMKCAVRGLHGEGSAAQGNLYQVSNQVTLGCTAGDILDSLERVVGQLLQCEAEARAAAAREIGPQIEDKAWRAFGLMCHARLLTAEEFMNLSSALRLGAALGLLPGAEVGMLNALMVKTKPSHIQAISGRELEPPERDIVRAEVVRMALSGTSS
jgi:protein arginine kinase